MAKNGDTKTITLFKVSYSDLGVANFAGGSITTAVKNYVEANLEKKMLSVGLKMISGFNIVFWLAEGLSAVYYVMGYEGVALKITFKYIVSTKHQAGNTFTTEGWRPQYIYPSNY